MASSNRLLKTSLALTFFAIFARLFGAAMQAAIAYRFGVSEKLDAFLIAFSIPTLVNDWFLTAVPVVTLIPILLVLKEEGKEHELDSFISSFVSILSLMVLSFTAVYLIFTPFIINSLAPGLDDNTLSLAVNLSRTLILSLFIYIGIGIYRALLHSQNKFITPILASMVVSSSLILSILFLPKSYNVYAIVAGYVIGSVLSLTILITMLKRTNFKFRFSMPKNSPHLQQAMKIFLAFLLIGATSNVNYLVDKFFASYLHSGSISILGYAEKFQILFTGIFAMAIAEPAFVNISGAAAKQSLDSIKEDLIKSVKFIAYLTLPLWVFFIIMRHQLVKLFFERGSFTSQDTNTVASVILFLSVAFLLLAFSQIVIMPFFAMGDTKWLIRLSLASIFMNIILNALFFRLLGVQGIALSTSIATVFANFGIWTVLYYKLKGLDLRHLLNFFTKIGASTALMTLPLLFFSSRLSSENFSSISLIGQLIMVSLICAFVYITSSYYFRVQEVVKVVSDLQSSISKSKVDSSDQLA